MEKKTPPIIEMKNVSLSFNSGPAVFEDLNLHIPQGSFHFLTGNSGAGKSSLLKLIYLAMFPTQGDVFVAEKNTKYIEMKNIPILRRMVGVVFQDFRLLPHLNAIENVALPLKVRGMNPSKAMKQAADLLKWVGLKNAIESKPSALSGGEQQRVAIARAVIGRPKILLADEPTGNVDDDLATKLLYLFEQMYKSGTTVIVATHNRALAQGFYYSEINLHGGQARIISPTKGERA